MADSRAQGIANVEFRQGSAYALPFEDSSFDPQKKPGSRLRDRRFNLEW